MKKRSETETVCPSGLSMPCCQHSGRTAPETSYAARHA